MTAGRTRRGVAATVAAAAAWAMTAAGSPVPARAHGAMDNPVSRAAACGAEVRPAVRSAACQAAVAASGSLAGWDSVRVPDVRGQDRAVIPDGRLCSGGIVAFRGLDLPRTDWPTTTLTAGAPFTFSYRQTIPHRGTFRLYVTRDGYQPTTPLRWADLEAQPFLQVTDPELRGAAYRLGGALPAGKTGRHLIYTVWQNSDTPDTYYSCSDVLFAAAGPAAGPVAAGAPARPSPTDARIVRGAPVTAPGTGAPAAGARAGRFERGLTLRAGTVVLAVGLVALAALLLARRRHHPERHHRRR